MIELAKSLGDFVARSLQSLGTHAWIPAMTLVVGVVFPLQIEATDNQSATEALKAMSDLGLGGAGVAILFIAVAAVFIQPFEYALIQVLEGYWGNSILAARVYAWRSKKFDERRAAINIRLVNAGVKLVSGEDDQRVIDFLARREEITTAQSVGSEVTADVTNEDVSEAPTDDAPIESLEQVRLRMALKRLPKAGDVMPTHLGNRLRAAELTASFLAEDGDDRSIQRRMLERLDRIPPQLRAQHDLHRSRLDLFCTMTFVWCAVTIWFAVRLGNEGWVALLVLAPMLAVPCSYYAALLAADGYGDVLRAIGQVFAKEDRQDPNAMPRAS